MSATDESSRADEAAPLTDQMLTMDMADTLSRSPEIAGVDDAAAALALLYRRLGIAVSDDQAREGIAAWRENRFAYRPPQGGLGAMLARLYVLRASWQPAAVAVALMLVIGFGGYYFVYTPYREAQLAEQQRQLAVDLPAQMDALYQSIFDVTKVQQPVIDAQGLVADGKAAAARGDRDGAEASVTALTQMRDTLQSAFRLVVSDRPAGKWGFWTFPKDNTDATNYFVVVEARDGDGNPVRIPIRDEETGRTDTVSTWALRIPEPIYRALAADKADNGVIEHYLIGVKDYGFLDPTYTVDVLGGTLTRW